MTTSFVFWNLGRRHVPALIADLAAEHEADVLILAECKIPLAELLNALNEGQRSQFSVPFDPARQLLMLVRGPSQSLRIVSDKRRISFRHLQLPAKTAILLAAAHLPSKQYRSPSDQTLFMVGVREAIEDAEKAVGHDRTVLVGDLNMNPFEDGMVAASCLHGTMDRGIAAGGHRTVDNEDRRFFYNPMWSLMGDLSRGPSGTYFDDRGGEVNLYWHTFDQVLVRPSLVPRLPADSVNVVTSIRGVSLLRNGRPDPRVASDHLPLVFGLDL